MLLSRNSKRLSRKLCYSGSGFYIDKMDNVKMCYISTGCNKGPHVLDWGFNDLICFASSNAIALYDPRFTSSSGRVLTTLIAHKARVNCVRWIRNNNKPERELISTSTDGYAVVWKKVNENERLNFEVGHRLKGHNETVTVADGIYIEEKLIVATASIDSTVKIWNRINGIDELECAQTINCDSGFALEIKFSLLPNSLVPLLACCLHDSSVILFIQQNCKFDKVHVLHGHEDWVRCIDFVSIEDMIFMATASQDTLIRIWKLSEFVDKSLDKEELRVKENTFTYESKGETRLMSVSVEAIMAGHENWVFGVHWQPKYKDGHQPLKLASASMDKTMILWSLDQDSDLWLEQVRVGQVGGDVLGFYGGKFSPDGKSMIAHGYQGAFHLWNFDQESNSWLPGVTVSGHFNEVVDLAWDPEGTFLLSTSLDQTTRLHAPWIRQKECITWHELGRPQIHGHDMSCLATISRYKFVSGADEKVLRLFEAPKNVVDNLSYLCDLSTDLEYKKMNQSSAQGASVPALGLSNKAVFADKNDDICFTPIKLKEPPPEQVLLQNTLWPEVQKLYGHGFELYCVASNHKGSLIASACKASKQEHAQIILWNVQTCTQITQLDSHLLTVTCLSFSPNDKYLLSVSRDRTWTVFEEKEMSNGEKKFEKLASTQQKSAIHSRIIWSCAWAPDSRTFFTGSRDKKVVAWKIEGKEVKPTGNLTTAQSVNALDVAPLQFSSRFLISIGLECGTILLYWFDSCQSSFTVYQQLPKSYCHNLCVKRLKFSPIISKDTSDDDDDDVYIHLASCGSDFAVRIMQLKMSKD